VRVGASLEKQPWVTIVGIVGNVKAFTVFREMALETTPTLYLPFSQAPTNTVHVLVRFSGDGHRLMAELPRQVSALDANLPVGPIKSVAGELSEKLKYPAFRARILTLFAILALLLACVGVYGVVSQLMVSRTREIGIRAALGATRRDIIGLISREGIRLVLAGTSIGLLIALVVTRTLTSLDFHG
jgi:putative ABC transport system permease protein